VERNDANGIITDSN